MAVKWFDRIRDTTASTGTGTLTVSGTAPVNYNTFSARYSTNDQFYAVIVNQNTNEWEVSLGTYLGANQFSRQTVLDGSSGAGTLVNFSAGTKDVAVVLPANFGVRRTLTTDTDYFVRTDGSDSNDGSANTAGSAWLTIQHGIDWITSNIDLGGHNAQIRVAAGTYSAGGSINLPFANGSLFITGDTTTPSNVLISTGSNDCFAIFAVGMNVTIQGFKLVGGIGVRIQGSSTLTLGKMEYGACTTAHIYVNAAGAVVNSGNTATITGAATFHVVCQAPGAEYVNQSAVTLSGTLAFTQFVNANFGALISTPTGLASYTGGTITGTRYSGGANSVINTNGGGANFYPGNVAGSTATGAQYL